jgi:GT2 family glycosyltransferase
MASMEVADLSIIIVNWNSKDYLRTCITSIKRSIKKLKYEIIVIDSASFDGCKEMLEMDFPEVRLVQSEINVGFARANNIGIEQASANMLLCLNPDTEVQDDAIEKLYESYQGLLSPGVIGSRLLNSDFSLQMSCVQVFPTILNQVLDAEILQRLFPTNSLWQSGLTYENFNKTVPVEVVSGACMMVNKNAMKHVGMFSENYFMYAEDHDLCYKLKKAGYINYYLPIVNIVHHGGGSSKKARTSFSTIMMRESIFRLLRKTHGNLYGFFYRISLGSVALVRIIFLLIYLPFWLINKNTQMYRDFATKWLSTLSWSVGLEKWVYLYDNLPKNFEIANKS